jgi:methylglyoxal reductase
MNLNKLEETNLLLPKIGFGCWAIGGHGYGKVDKKETLRSIDCAIDNGISFFDTANVYGFGKSEKILGEALEKKRDKVIIASKCGILWDRHGKTYKTLKPNDIKKSLHDSLVRLKTDYIDLFQIHWLDGVTAIEPIMEQLIKLRDEGKINHIGCSNFSSLDIHSFQKFGRLETTQNQYNIVQKSELDEINNVCKHYKMGIITYSLLGRGLLTGKYGLHSKFGKNDTRSRIKNLTPDVYTKFISVSKKLALVSKNLDISPSQLLIKLSLLNNLITLRLIGFTNVRHIKECMKATTLSFSNVDLLYINKELNSELL